MRAMILAAGHGTRLGILGRQRPKPMLPVCDQPLVSWALRWISQHGLAQAAVNLHHLGTQIRAWVDDGPHHGLDVVYSDESTLLGTGGGIRKALRLLGDETFLVVNGDILFAPDIARLVESHNETGAIATLMVRDDSRAEKLGAVGLDAADRIRRLVWAGDTAAPLRNTVFTGVHILTPELACHLPEEGCIVRKTYIPLLEDGALLHAVTDNGFWHDLGTCEQYLEASCALVTGQTRLPGFCPPADGVFVGSDVALGQGCRLEPGAIIGDGAALAPGVTVGRAIVFPGAEVMRDTHRAIVTDRETIHLP